MPKYNREEITFLVGCRRDLHDKILDEMLRFHQELECLDGVFEVDSSLKTEEEPGCRKLD